jgi:murein DD-endopeptidase MepM/ murein hydrolase activator NlpD
VLAAASGTLTMPSAGASNGVFFSSDALQRPEAANRTESGLDTVVAAGQSLKEESAERAEAAHEAAVEQARKEAAERKARQEREARRWVAPLSSYRISATFGSTGRLWSGTHTGVDLAASYGTEVKSLSSGEIIWTGWDGSYGNKIVVRHWDGTETWYCHLSRFIKRSGSVAPGEVIGAVGSTGNSTGPHLHLEVHPEGSGAVNPQNWLSERGLNL